MSGSPKKILLSNDDGIFAPGIAALYEQISKLGDVTVVAPSGEQSAVGHAITLSDPLRVFPFHKNGIFFGHAVNGTPADCVKIAYWALLNEKPDLVVSGVNQGSNAGINAIYSGTVSAATEGAILGIPSFAVSLASWSDSNFNYAAELARNIAEKVLQNGLPEGVLLNVNVPALPREEIAGIRVTRQGQSKYEEHFDKRRDPANRTYYWLTGKKIEVEQDLDVDDYAISQNYVAVTPLQYDLTSYNFLETLKTWQFR